MVCFSVPSAFCGLVLCYLKVVHKEQKNQKLTDAE